MQTRTLFLAFIRPQRFVSSFVVICSLVSQLAFSVSPENLSIAADYYQRRYDYPQALQLWREIYRRNPLHPQAAFRLMELKLVQEGRASVTDFVTAHFKKFPEGRGPSRDALILRLRELQETFLTEDGQTFYLQSLPKKQHKDCLGAIGLLSQSQLAEKGNLLVLKEKADCEKWLAMYDKYHATLKASKELNPFSREINEELSGAHLYFGGYDAILAENHELSRELQGIKVRLIVAFALIEKGRENEALTEFRALATDKSWKPEEFSLIQFGLGKTMLMKPHLREAGVAELKAFLQTVRSGKEKSQSPAEPVAGIATDIWDPFKRDAKVLEAEKLLAEVRPSLSQH